MLVLLKKKYIYVIYKVFRNKNKTFNLQMIRNFNWQIKYLIENVYANLFFQLYITDDLKK